MGDNKSNCMQPKNEAAGASTNCVVFLDIGRTFATPRISAAGKLIRLEPNPAVRPILRRLKDRHIRLGIISNTRTSDTVVTMRKLLSDCDLYPLFDPELLVYTSTTPNHDPQTGEAIKPKPDPSIFRYAAGLAGADSECVFVGEDARERAGAVTANMRVAASLVLVEDVLAGIPLRYVRVGPPQGITDKSWRSALLSVPIVVLGILDDKVVAIASAATAGRLDDAGYEVIRLGAPRAPDITDVYLLRDDARTDPSLEFSVSGAGSSRRFFSAALPSEGEHEANVDAFSASVKAPDDEPWNWVLSSDDSGLLVAIPAGQSIENFHFSNARHGHTLKLIPSSKRLKAFESVAGFGSAATRELRTDEIEQLGHLNADHLRRNLDRFVGKVDLGDGSGAIRSRHIKHPDNARAVRALAAEFERLGLQTRLHRFLHEGTALDNIEAELAGQSDEIVMITAHLDSTAAEGEGGYHPSLDDAPGADDDGSGIAATLSLAQILASRAQTGQLQRTVRFVLFNAEEQGLIGSQFYASDAADRGDPIIGVFQMDMIGYSGQNQTSTPTSTPRAFEIHIGHGNPAMTTASRPLVELIRGNQPVVAPGLKPPELYDNTHPQDGDPAAGRSDHASFHDHGFPACVLSENFFVGPDATSPAPQKNPYYHKPGDTSVDYDYAAQIARCIGAAVFLIADPDQRVSPNGLQDGDYQKLVELFAALPDRDKGRLLAALENA